MKRPKRDIDWLQALDFSLALKNLQVEFKGAWYRDPWGWPEVTWVAKHRPAVLIDRLNRSGVWRSYPIDVPKENFAFRPAIVLDPIDRLCYQALVDQLSPRLIKSLSSWVYGWRLPFNEPIKGEYARNDYQYANYRSRLKWLANNFRCGLRTDVISYFANVNIDSIEEMVKTRSGTSRVQSRLLDLLRHWNRLPTRSGLPQRSFASAALANMYLSPIDDVIRYHGMIDRTKNGFSPCVAACRWMDDIWLFNNDSGFLRNAQVEIQRNLREIGLDMNFAKTQVLEEEKLVTKVHDLEHSAVDNGFRGPLINEGPLMDLIDKLLDEPETASRTSIRFVTTRMYQNRVLDRVDDLIDKAHRMPHGADHLARLFHRSQRWRDLADWYLKYSRGPWATIEWSVAQFGTMFPSNEGNHDLGDYFGNSLSKGNSSLPLMSLAAQRLASWNTDTARAVIREARFTSSHPLERRSLALAGLMANEEHRLIRQLLNEFEENRITLDMLEAKGWKPPSLVGDFN